MMPLKYGPRTASVGELPIRMFYRIGDISRWLDVPTHVLRYWETEFAVHLPVERSKHGQRIYNRQQAVRLAVIKELLYVELYTIAGAKRQLRLAAEREREVG